MKKILYILLVSLIVMGVTGCTTKNRAYERSLLDIDWASTPDVKSTINQSINDMADQLLKHSRISIKDNVAITSFVDLHQLNKTTYFGRKISESFFNELHVRGLNVVDIRGTSNIRINADGEFFITRDIKLLDKKIIESSYILVGTYSKFGKGILINARILDNRTGLAVSTARTILDIDACDIYENCYKTNEIKKEPAIVAKVQKRTIGLTDAGCSYVTCPVNCVNNACYANTKKVIKKDPIRVPQKKYCEHSIPQTLYKSK